MLEIFHIAGSKLGVVLLTNGGDLSISRMHYPAGTLAVGN